MIQCRCPGRQMISVSDYQDGHESDCPYSRVVTIWSGCPYCPGDQDRCPGVHQHLKELKDSSCQ